MDDTSVIINADFVHLTGIYRNNIDWLMYYEKKAETTMVINSTNFNKTNNVVNWLFQKVEYVWIMQYSVL